MCCGYRLSVIKIGSQTHVPILFFSHIGSQTHILAVIQLLWYMQCIASLC